MTDYFAETLQKWITYIELHRTWADVIILKSLLSDSKGNYETFLLDIQDFYKTRDLVVLLEETILLGSLKEILSFKKVFPYEARHSGLASHQKT